MLYKKKTKMTLFNNKIINSKEMFLKGEFYTTIEIPLHDTIKYEIDKASNNLMLDRVLNVAMGYPCNYGYIEGTLGKDGDAIDVCMILDKPIVPGAYVLSRAVGVLLMEDESGVDQKILAVPVKSEFNYLKNINEVPQTLLNKIQHFFERYKDLEKGKWVKVDQWKNKDAAIQILLDSCTI